VVIKGVFMNLTLTRGDNTEDNTGVYGSMISDDGAFSCVTLERLFDGVLKIPTGQYQCALGTFTLEGYPPAQYWQIMNVPNHQDILIHFANYTHQLNGCVAVGRTLATNMITSSDVTFDKLMAFEANSGGFILTIK
jgi:hypothetical protein